MGIRSAQRTMDASLPSDCSESLSDAFRRHPSRETESNTPAARCISRLRAVRAPYIPFLGPGKARCCGVIAKPQNHPAVPGKDDALTIMLDESKLLEFT